VEPIRFGTDGWRGIISFDFTFPKTVIVAEAVRRYVAETGLTARPLLIGYDNRFLAAEFAFNAANYLAASGQPTAVFAAAVPTPVCAFGVRHRQAAGALMFTASHNPYYYLGIKFIPCFAGPAEAPTTERITAIIRELEAAAFSPPPLNAEWHGERLDLRADYFSHLDSIVNAPALASLHGRFLYAAFHGVGAGWLDGYLRERGVSVEPRFAERDVLFGGRLPDPSPANLQLLQEELATSGYDLAFATDGDADRFGALAPDGTYFGCNQVLPLVADYLLTVKGRRGPLVRTVSTSHTLDSVAAAHGVELKETPVGFKHVGRLLREGALIGGEESGGMSVAGHVPEKDAILSIVLLLELLATAGGQLEELWRQFGQRFGHRHFERLDLELAPEAKDQLMTRVAAQAAGEKFLGRPVAQRVTIDGVKLVFSDSSWVLFRPSGTEAVVRVYVEAVDAHSFRELRESVVSYLEDRVASK